MLKITLHINIIFNDIRDKFELREGSDIYNFMHDMW